MHNFNNPCHFNPLTYCDYAKRTSFLFSDPDSCCCNKVHVAFIYSYI